MGILIFRWLCGCDASGPVVTDWRAIGYTLLRVFFGFAIFMHGFPVVSDPDKVEKFAGVLESMSIPMPLAAAWAAKGTECVGGLLLAVGLLTRPAAIALAIVLAVAAFVAHGDHPFFAAPGEKSKEHALMYLVAFVTLAIMGPGPVAVDRLIKPVLPKVKH